jgi:hypothetical protein
MTRICLYTRISTDEENLSYVLSTRPHPPPAGATRPSTASSPTRPTSDASAGATKTSSQRTSH